MVLLRTRGTETEVLKEIPLTAGKRLVRLECNGAEQALRLLPQYPDCYIELTLHLSAPLASAETEALKSANEGLISLITQVTAETTAVPVGRSRMSEEELFGEYYRSLYGEPPAEELKTAFLMLLGEGA